MSEARRRILVVDLSKRHGGADVRVRQIAVTLRERCAIAVAVLRGSPIAKELEALGVTTFPIGRKRHDPRILSDLIPIARRFRPDVIDAHNPQSQLWAMLAAARLGLPGLVTVHSSYRKAHPGRFRPLAHEACLRLAAALGAEFLAVAPSVLGYLDNLGLRPSRVHLSLNGIEPLPGPVLGSGLRTAIGLRPDDFLVGIVGRIDPIKGHDVLVRAADRLRREGRPVHVLVVGEGDHRPALVGQIAELGLSGHVHLVGFRHDVPAVLAELDGLCIPSRSEGLPYTVLEAARQGVPIVASAAEGLKAILDDEATALIVPIDDDAGLAQALLRLREEPALRERLGAAGRAMVAARYSVERMAEETLALYRTIGGTSGEHGGRGVEGERGTYAPARAESPGEPGL